MNTAPIKRFLGSLAAGSLLALAVLAYMSTAPNAPEANAELCTGRWTIGVGGMTFGAQGTWQTSEYLTANERVAHDSLNPSSGIGYLSRAYWNHSQRCPGDHITVLGHSEGAHVVDQWAAGYGWLPNVSLVLLARPGGIAPTTTQMPVLSICRENDVVCNPATDVSGYLLRDAHTSYDYNAFNYGDNDSGLIWLPAT